jgi:putative phosphoesterase
MKIVVIGDTHDNIQNIRHVMGFSEKIKAEAVIHTGDWSNLKTYKEIKSYKIKTYGVLGNADISSEIKSKLDEFLELEIDNLKIGLIHNIKKLKLIENWKFKIENLDIVFCGHEHKQYQKNKFINPGSLENDINFAIFDTKTKRVEFINNDKI